MTAETKKLAAQGLVIPGYIDGLITEISTADPDHDIIIVAGSATDSTNSVNMISSTSFTKRIDVVWAPGAFAGGRPSAVALANNTWYHLFQISKADGTVDFGWDTNITAINLLSDATDYIFFRMIWSHLTDGSANIVGYIQYIDRMYFDAKPQDLSLLGIPVGFNFVSVTTPLGISTIALGTFSAEEISATFTPRFHVLYSPDSPDIAPSSSNAFFETNPSQKWVSASFEIPTDIQSRLKHSSTVSVDLFFKIYTSGCIHPRK